MKSNVPEDPAYSTPGVLNFLSDPSGILCATEFLFISKVSLDLKSSKVREMPNSSEVFKPDFDFYQRVAHNLTIFKE
jgi:hypothetical protein